jgi:rhodanese-related sulfurtransferase
MSLIKIDAKRARSMMDQGAILIDIRDIDEHAREHIAQALHIPLSKLSDKRLETAGKPIIYYCKSGNRTRLNAELLIKAGGPCVHVLEGGIEGWKAAGHPVKKDARQPLEMMRQVQIAAGFLALAGAALGYLLHPAIYALSAAVGAGLMFSGISGTCAMATVLKKMPWNRVSA